jgi:hypothetical protein
VRWRTLNNWTSPWNCAAFFCAARQQALDRPPFDIDTAVVCQLIGDSLATQVWSLPGEFVNPGDIFIRQFEAVPPTRFVVAQAGDTTLLEAALRLVERLAREAERCGHHDDALSIDEMRPQHLVLDLDLVEWVEEALLEEQLCPYRLRMRVQSTGSSQVLALRMVSRVQPPGDATVRSTLISVN